MGYVPGFNNDIFISYSHIDDQAVDGPGWVTDFHRRLLIEVEEELGAKVQIWRDKRITGATDFTKDLDKQVRGSAMLVAILSPGYVNSQWCDWELTGFARSRRIGDLWVDTKCRALKVFKRPADVGRLRVLAETEGVKFFDVDPATEVSHEMAGSSEMFKHRLTELGNDIGFVLRAMRRARTVFLGTASASLQDQRERVRQELSGRGYRIVTTPEGATNDSAIMSLRPAVRESALAVLFYDRTAPTASAEVRGSLERRVAIDQQATQIIVVRGQSDTGSQPWDEPDATGRGSAKVEWLIEPQTHTLYHTVLQMLEPQPAAPSSGSDPPPADDSARPPDVSEPPTFTPTDRAGPQKLVRVYLICDQQDHPLLEPNRARRLRDHLLALGFEVKLPLAEHDAAAQFSRDNRNKMKQCDAVLLYWGTARQAWFDQRLGELMQARGWRQGRAFAALGAYFADPQSPVKQNYETRELDELIKQFDDFDLTDARLVRFVGRLGQGT
jgi:TIR domain